MNKKELLEYLDNNNAFKGNLLSSGITKRLSRDKDALESLQHIVQDGSSISEKLYLLKHSPSMCEVCGSKTPFKTYSEGYERFCGKDCRKASAKLAYEKACLAKYGVKRPAQSKAILEKMATTKEKNNKPITRTKRTHNSEKYKQTCLEKYGVDHPMKVQSIKEKTATKLKEKQEELLAKRQATMLAKYGTSNTNLIPGRREKNAISKWNSTYDKLVGSDRLKERVLVRFAKEDFKGVYEEYPFECCLCHTVFNSSLKNGQVPKCPTCYPTDRGKGRNPIEDDIIQLIRSHLPDELIIQNDRKVLNGKELDIYLPNKKVAIEFNENYWHRESCGRGKDYHIWKTEQCESLGIRLLHIFDDEWNDKRDIVESIILSSLGIYPNKIGARSLSIIHPKTLASFYDDNHLQGPAKSSVNLALVDKDGQVLAGLSFAKPRFGKRADWELTRFAVMTGWSIPGAFQRLLAAFKADHPDESVLTFSDRRLFSGAVYRKAGFEELRPTPPSYWYVKSPYKERENRLKYQKHKIPNVDMKLTEFENMSLLGYDRIWDCGCWSFILK